MNPLTASTSETYELLVSLLSRCPQAIEILPGDGSAWLDPQDPSANVASESSFGPFLFVEGNLGIPQKILYRVYLYAVSVFKSARSCVQTRSTRTVQRDPDVDTSLAHILDSSSSILILANPSHQTALNVRKHLVGMDLIDAHTELRFIASLLSSHHCVKHAELWYHRRWLLSYACGTQTLDASGVDSYSRLQFASREAFQQELELVSRACELYPRNYFAWTHRLVCMQSVLSDYLTGVDPVGFVPIFRDQIMRIKTWIDSHVSDYSAVHSIVSLSQVVFRSKDLSLTEIVIEENLQEHAISLVQEYPTHEALWMYIRTTCSLPDLQQTRKIKEFVEDFVQPLVHLQQSGIGMKADLVKASQYARQFLDERPGH